MQDATPIAWWQTQRATVLLAVAAAVPLCWTTIPWLTDVPAHVARFHIQQTIGQSPELAGHFDFTWRLIPNLGVDLLVVPLGKLFGLLPAVTIVTALIPALTVLGIFAVVRAVHGRVTTISLFALPLAHSYPFQFGFLNSCLSVALALLVFALWLRSGQGQRILVAAVAAPLLIVTHAIGWGVLGVLIGGATIATLWQERARPAAWVRQGGGTVLPLLWPLAILIAWRGDSHNAIGLWFDWRNDLIWLAGMLRDRWIALDGTATIAVLAAATLPVWRSRRFAYVPVIVVPAVILAILSLAMPNELLGSMFAATRLIPVAIMLAILAVREMRPLPRWIGWIALALFAARLISVTTSQLAAEHTAQTQIAALDRLPRGARVMALVREHCEQRWQLPRLWHLPSVATIRRDALVNDLFAAPGQLLSVRDRTGSNWWTLQGQAVPRQGCRRGQWPVFDDLLTRVPWRDIDYLWILNSERDRIRRDHPVTLVWNNGRTQLYRVDHRGDASAVRQR
ncbi:hypothetical protein ASG37_03150 [Sphingomonas sp. Leaf407]|uniref:hypothetical protein n=1 Tax=unclassified Sphingomonas TaxID=196159 RepID=UPI000700B23E|nr:MULTISPECIES: hypothetical protein [unclassified Sphingomonas]KQN40785.1 hypothetical protein ASE97_03175 [Sphingomonas sp. Leaf42]KQT30140.1 hypothetical protein ASG37_03150 [Sphingomonas sp. Leaf407]